ncbi:MAG: 16S rRNA (uracil(1498)-N(3))-methyltransferase, partial [Desulfobacula sp.]|nr:16S rRNA (uracil(1498)-N(3))-methyltransferase [Desulfobacula sp.]
KTDITGQDAKHIFKVLRKKKGDQISITDGKGRDYKAIISMALPHAIKINIIEKCEVRTESFINITLCSGMLKDKKMDFIIKHVTQFGIQKWIPFFCERSIPSPNIKKIKARKKRWESIAKESLKQCNRSCIPKISDPLSFQTLVEQSENHDLKVTFHEKSNQKIKTLQKNIPPKKIIILIGPEGGFSPKEILLAEEKGFISHTLGPRILRAETASIAACTLIQHIFGDI